MTTLDSFARKIRSVSNRPHALYQPIVGHPGENGEPGEISFEALARYELEGSIISPFAFLPVLKQEPKLMASCDTSMAILAVNQLARWREVGMPVESIHVNVDPITLQDFGYAYVMHEILNGLDDDIRGRVVVELVEPISFWEDDKIMRSVMFLTDIGVTFAIDDIPYWDKLSDLMAWVNCSLNGVSCLKLDREFVRKVCSGEAKEVSEMKAIALVAERLKLGLIAEGIEFPGDRETMLEYGVGGFQGYGIGKPMQPGEVGDFVANYLEAQRFCPLLQHRGVGERRLSA